MALTPEEREELRRLRALARATADREAGDLARQQAARARAAAAPPADPAEAFRFAPIPFPVLRAVLTGGRDLVNGVVGAADSVGDALGRATGVGGLFFGSQASNGVVEYAGYDEFNRRGGDAVFGDSGYTPQITGRVVGEDQAGFVESASRQLVAFGVPYAGALRALGGLRAGSMLSFRNVSRASAAGSAAAFVQADPVSGNFANFARDYLGLDAPVIEALAGSADAPDFENRVKAAIADVPLGIAADALLHLGSRAIRAYGASRAVEAEVEEIIRAADDVTVADPAARNLTPAPAGAAVTSPVALREAAQEVPTATARRAPRERLKAAVTESPPADFDDVATRLREIAGDPDTDLAAANALVREMFEETPQNALARVGVDPVKLDFSKFEDPTALDRMLGSLVDVQTAVGTRTGRTGIRVTAAATVRAARDLGTTPEALLRVNDKTSNLAEHLRAGQLFVGAHTHRLLASADEAMAEITAGRAGPAWERFLVDFNRHALFVGTIRGAATEIGRALRSLQELTRVGAKDAARMLDNAVSEEAASQVGRTSRGSKQASIQEAATEWVRAIETDADRITALAELKSLNGDVGEIARHVRQKNLSAFQRVDEALRETIGNLFSPATGLWNIASTASVFTTRLLTRLAAGTARAALCPFGRSHCAAMRFHIVDAQAYAAGALSGFREAVSNTLSVLRKEIGAELSLNADRIGFHEVGQQLAGWSAEGARRMTRGVFERKETTNLRSFGVSNAEITKLAETITRQTGPQFYQDAIKAIIRLGAAPINAAGSLSRLGTILFINAPDQLAGTLMARAGARTQAVRIASGEAAELGLEGPEWSRFVTERTRQLSDTVNGWSNDAFDDGAREAIARQGGADTIDAMLEAGKREAREGLYQDALETAWVERMSRIAKVPLLHLAIPFVHTPLRILERTIIDHTPLGLAKERVRKAIAAGGPQRDEALARLALSMLAITTAFQLADDRTVVGHDGSFTSSARVAGRPSYSIKAFDKVIEFNRLDAAGILLGFGSDMRSFMDAMEEDPEGERGFGVLYEMMLWTVVPNVLHKSWLTGFRSIVDVVSAPDEDAAAAAWNRLATTTAARFVPASGIQRQAEKAEHATVRAGDTFIDAMIANSIGADQVPIKRDHLLGRPVPVVGAERYFGTRIADAPEDPLLAELERLSFDVGRQRRTIEGVRMNAAQFSRWLELRGQVARNPESGLTMEEQLRLLITLPVYEQASREGRIDLIRQETEGFGRPATVQLLREDPRLHYRVLRSEVWTRLARGGHSTPQQRIDETRRVAEELGIPVFEDEDD